MSKTPATAEEKFAQRHDQLFRFRRPSGTAAWIGTGSGVAGLVAYFTLSELAHWPGWAAIGTGIAVWLTGHVIADMWPRPVPPELAGEVARMQAGGSTLLRRHPFWCLEKAPHAHMTDPRVPAILVVWCGESPHPAGTHWRAGRKPVVVVERWRETEISRLRPVRPYIAPVETGEPFRSGAEAEWDSSRGD